LVADGYILLDGVVNNSSQHVNYIISAQPVLIAYLDKN